MAGNGGSSGNDHRRVATLRQILGVSESAMDQATAIAYQFYLTGRFVDAETLCKGLIACDPHYWWSHSLHASVLRRLGRHEEALIAVELGLRFEPGQAKLLLMRTELLLTIARKKAANVHAAQATRSSLPPLAAAEAFRDVLNAPAVGASR